MLSTDSIDYHNYLPPYRSLLNPTARYDYQTHSLIPLSQNDLKLLKTIYQKKKEPQPFKMKYKSLLSDVSRSISLRISNSNLLSSSNMPPPPSSDGSSTSTIQQFPASSSNISVSGGTVPSTTNQNNSCLNCLNTYQQPVELHIKNLPIEILDYIFYLVDDKMDYKSCMFTCKLFYFLSKPYYYEELLFVSTYRFAQFISYLRLNSDVGQYVRSIDLSGIKPSYDEDEDEQQQQHHQNHNNHNNNNHHDQQRPGALVDQMDHDEIHPDNNSEKVDLFPSGKVYAGWRDWKFKNNPLYTVHAPPTTSLTKIASNSQYLINSSKSLNSTKSSSSSSKKFTKPFKYFKSRKRSRSYSGGSSSTGFGNHNKGESRKAPKLQFLQLDSQTSINNWTRNYAPHPMINKFLINYSTTKDVPIGYILHLINLCPNLVSLNLGNLSLSTDYEISRATVYKYQNFDLMNNYPKDLVRKIDKIMRVSDHDDIYSINGYQSSILRFESKNNYLDNLYKSNQSTASTVSSVYSITTFSKPIRKYNSLLPPLPPTVADISYLNKGDGKVYLSDLNLKSINNSYLNRVHEEQILSSIIKNHGKRVINFDSFTIPTVINAEISGKLNYINLSSMIWLNRSMIENFLSKLLTRRRSELKLYGIYDDCTDFSVDVDSDDDDDEYSDSGPEDGNEDYEHHLGRSTVYKQDLIIDFTDSGMYKNLPWAKRIDLNTYGGCQLANKIIKNDLLTPHEEQMRRDRRRRGRLAENYLS